MENDLSTRSREINVDSISNVLRISLDIEFWYGTRFEGGREQSNSRIDRHLYEFSTDLFCFLLVSSRSF